MYRALVLLLLISTQVASASTLSGEAAFRKVKSDREMRSMRFERPISETDSLYNQALSYQNSKFGAHSLATGIQLSKWGDECVGRGTNASAALLFRKAAAILERYPGKAPSELADCYRGFAYNDQDNKRWFSAETNFKRALELEKTDPSLANSERHAMTLNMVGKALSEQKKWKEAESYFSQSLKMREKTYGLVDSTTLSAMRDLADAQKHLGSTSLQEKWKRLSVENTKKDIGPKLAPVYERLHNEVQSLPNCCVLPVAKSLVRNKPFQEAIVEKELDLKFGGKQNLRYKIPNWMAGLWGEIPANTATVEVDGYLVSPNCFNPHMGSGPYASRHGKEFTGKSWFDLNRQNQNIECWWSTKPSDKTTEYTFCRRHNGFITSHDDLILRSSLVNVLVKSGRTATVWQEDQIEAWRRLEDGNAAVYKATRLFDSNGKGIDEAPDGSGNEPTNNISVIKKVGGPHTY